MDLQDHHSFCCGRVGPGICRYNQLGAVRLHQAVRLHHEDDAAALASCHCVLHHQAKIRDSIRPILLYVRRPVRRMCADLSCSISVWKWTGARVIAVFSARRFLHLHYVRWFGHSCKSLPRSTRCLPNLKPPRNICPPSLLLAEAVPGIEEEYPCTLRSPVIRITSKGLCGG